MREVGIKISFKVFTSLYDNQKIKSIVKLWSEILSKFSFKI